MTLLKNSLKILLLIIIINPMLLFYYLFLIIKNFMIQLFILPKSFLFFMLGMIFYSLYYIKHIKSTDAESIKWIIKHLNETYNDLILNRRGIV